MQDDLAELIRRKAPREKDPKVFRHWVKLLLLARAEGLKEIARLRELVPKPDKVLQLGFDRPLPNRNE